ncbi:DNA-dependent ATPase fun30, partial [Linderina pennispora]
MPEPAVEPLAPNTPERISSSQSSTHSSDVMVLESSPGRPGTSRVAHINKSGVQRLSSFFYNAPKHQSPASSPPLVPSPKPATFTAQRPPAKDFGSIVRQFRWTGASSDEDEPFSKKRRPINSVNSEIAKRPRAVVISDDDDDDDDDDMVVRPGRRLQRGRAPRVSIPDDIDNDDVVEKKIPQYAVVSDSEESDDDAAEQPFQRSFENIEPHVMRLFNEASDEELMEKTNATMAEVKLIKEMRPFEDMDEIEYSLRKARGVRLAIFNHYRDTVLGHAEVEQVIHQCSGIFTQLKSAMAKAGVATDEKTGQVTIQQGVELHQPAMVSSQFQLKHYQLEGVEWLHCLRNANASGILADEMGLGKTFQVIAFLCRAIEEGKQRKPSLVVCPSSTLENWMNECRRFAPNLRAVAYYGSQAERAALQSELEDPKAYDVMVTTYNVATGNKLDRMFLKRRGFSAMVLDEGHMVKNCMSSRYKWLMQIRADFRLLLTGTPLQNNLQELVSLLTFILPSVFSDSQEMLRHAFKT